MSFKQYSQAIKTFIWGIVGLIVAFYMFSSPMRIFGQVLFVLSILMFFLAIYQTIKSKK